MAKPMISTAGDVSAAEISWMTSSWATGRKRRGESIRESEREAMAIFEKVSHRNKKGVNPICLTP
jgi:hypothetical protein